MAKQVAGRALLADLLDTTDAPHAAPPPTGGPAFTVDRHALLRSLERTAAVVPTRDVMDVLKNLHVDTGDGRLRITATDMRLTLIVTVDGATVARTGTAVVPARRFLDIIREAGDGDATITVTGTTARITVARTVWTLRLASGADYPTLPDLDDTVLTDIDRGTVTTALRQVRYAAGRDSGRAALTLVDIRDGNATACDGARFQQARFAPLPFAVTVPAAAVDDLLAILAKTTTDTVGIGHSTHHLIFRLGADLLVVNKPTAVYPDMEATLLRPALTNRHPFTVARADLLAAVKRVRINADPDTAAVALRLHADTCAVSSRDQYGNDATEVIPATWAGRERTVVVNHAYLTDLIAANPDPTLHFQLGDDTRTRKTPLLLRGDTGATAVIQQMLADWVPA